MAKYTLSNQAIEDLIRIYQYGVNEFGQTQADLYFDAFFDQFEIIAKRPLAFETVDYIKTGYRRCVCGVDSIFFRLNKHTVEIMSIIGRQDLDQLFK